MHLTKDKHGTSIFFHQLTTFIHQNSYITLLIPLPSIKRLSDTSSIFRRYIFSEENLLAQWIPGVTSFILSDFLSFSWIQKAQIFLFTFFYDLQHHVFDSLRSILPYPVGPCIPYINMTQRVKETISCNGSEGDHVSWLDSTL